MKRWGVLLLVLAAALLVAGGLSHLASSEPDGLERVAMDQGFAGRASSEPVGPRVMTDYEIPGVEPGGWGRTVAGLAGTLVVLAAGLGLGRLLRRPRPRRRS